MIMILILAFAIGVVAGLRALTPLAAVAWGARLNIWQLIGTHLAWIGNAIAPWVLTLLALGEVVNDKLPGTPSRKVPPQFIARVLSGAFCGAVVGGARESLVLGLIAGAVGAVAGTYGGAALRTKLAALFANDFPAALVEDVLAIGLAITIVSLV
jgi:uncharacterized membrane protein